MTFFECARSSRIVLRCLVLTVGLVALPGCAILHRGGGDKNTATASQLISQAQDKAKSGDDEGAVDLLHQAAEKNPVDATPWLDIARIRFNANDYIDALVASQEVLSRDPKSAKGNSIALVSSLRMAERSLGQLSQSADLEGSTRQQAQQLAKQLRSTLGEDSLLSSDEAGSSSHSSHRARKRTTHHVTRSHASHKTSHSASSGSTSSTPDSAKQKSSDNSDSSLNPFETLQKLPQ